MTKVAYTIPEFLEAYAVGRTKLYEDINSGALKARKNGRRTIILQRDADEWLSQLPAYSHKSSAA